MKPPITLATVAGIPILWDGEEMSFTAGMMINADGSPRAYHPVSKKGLDSHSACGYPDKPQYYTDILVCNGTKPVVQDGRSTKQPYQGFFISMTALVRKGKERDDVNKYIDSETIPHVTLPGNIFKAVGPILLGCRCVVTDIKTGIEVEAVLADKGPKGKLGEGSIALAKALGLNSNPRTGGTLEKRYLYQIYPGIAAEVNGEKFALQPS